MIRWSRHAARQQLYDCYYAERAGEPIDPRLAEHLTDCPACNARFADVARTLDEVRDAGLADADAVFTAERLRAQQLQIARRLEHAGRPARVISFPGQATPRAHGARSRVAPRWIAAAAAAGLFVGVAVGASYEWEWHAQPRDAHATATARLTPVATRGTGTVDVAADDAFLSELDAALERPHLRELVAYDALTPHVREVNTQR
ncbi:MAG TPA: hypothetical protein VFA27_07750 [Vicinamibacterales bacterium]|nr:hypothetical protein [Vicinamibacterales bacterium]